MARHTGEEAINLGELHKKAGKFEELRKRAFLKRLCADLEARRAS